MRASILFNKPSEVIRNSTATSQPAITCLKLTIETLENFVIAFLLLTLSRQIPVGIPVTSYK